MQLLSKASGFFFASTAGVLSLKLDYRRSPVCVGNVPVDDGHIPSSHELTVLEDEDLLPISISCMV